MHGPFRSCAGRSRRACVNVAIVGSSECARQSDCIGGPGVAAQRVRLTNQLHALVRDPIPGGAPLALTAKSASTLLRSVRPASSPERTRKELAQDVVRDRRAVDAALKESEKRMSNALDERGTRLRNVNGVGSVTAARLIGRTGRASKFRSADAFAACADVAPVEIASGDRQRHRLSRSGDRQLTRRSISLRPRR